MWHQWFNRNVMNFFVCKENKNNDFIQKCLLFHVSLWCSFMTVPQRMRVHSSACKQGTAHVCSMSECGLLRQQHHMHASYRAVKNKFEFRIFVEFKIKMQKCQPRHTDTSSTFIYALIWTKTAYPCGAADTEQCTPFASSGYSPKWSYADSEETNCWIKSLFLFSLRTKNILVAS